MNEPANLDELSIVEQKVDSGRETRLTLLILVCCAGFFIADVATPICFEEPFPAMIALGIVTAQLTVICVWGTLVQGTFWIRLPWTLLLLVIAWCGFAWGIALENNGRDTHAMITTAAFWLVGFVTSFVPLKIAAMCFRWQIIQESASGSDSEKESSYTIREIMTGTLLLALSMGIGRAIMPEEDINVMAALNSSVFRDAEPLIATAIFGVVSLLVKLPCIWIALGEKKEKIPSRIGLWVGYCLGLAVFEIGLLVAILGDPGGQTGELFFGLMLSHQLMGAIILGVCLALRGMGYRLERSLTSAA